MQERPDRTRCVEMQEEGAGVYETQSARIEPEVLYKQDARWVLLGNVWRRVVLKLELESERCQAHADLHQASRHRAYRLASEHVPQPPSHKSPTRQVFTQLASCCLWGEPSKPGMPNSCAIDWSAAWVCGVSYTDTTAC
jgi:hypothetical protein